jgi:hypothetical protein
MRAPGMPCRQTHVRDATNRLRPPRSVSSDDDARVCFHVSGGRHRSGGHINVEQRIVCKQSSAEAVTFSTQAGQALTCHAVTVSPTKLLKKRACCSL